MSNEEIQAYFHNMFHKHDGQIQIQGIGWSDAKKAEDFKVGEKILCNFGYTETIVNIENVGKTMLKFFVEINGKIFERKTRKTTMWAIA